MTKPRTHSIFGRITLGATLVSVLLQPIKLDLGFSDAMIGLVTGIAISIVGGFAAFPIAAHHQVLGIYNLTMAGGVPAAA